MSDYLTAARHAAGKLRRTTTVYDRDDAYQDAALAAWLYGPASPALLSVVAYRRMVERFRQTLGRTPATQRIAMPLHFSQVELDDRDGAASFGADAPGYAAVDAADGWDVIVRRAIVSLAAVHPDLGTGGSVPDVDQRLEILRLTYADGLTRTEVAQCLGCSTANVDQLAAKTLRHLRADPAFQRAYSEVS